MVLNQTSVTELLTSEGRISLFYFHVTHLYFSLNNCQVYFKLAGHSKRPFRWLGFAPILNYNFYHKCGTLSGRKNMFFCLWVRTTETRPVSIIFSFSKAVTNSIPTTRGHAPMPTLPHLLHTFKLD